MPVLAVLKHDDFLYQLFYLLHILSMIVAFAPQFVWPFVTVRLRKEGRSVSSSVGTLLEGNSTKIHGPALALAGILGFGLIGFSDDVYEFSQAWISIAMLLWFLALGVVFGLMAPAEKRAAAGDADADRKLSMYGGMLHLLLFLLLVDMVWKPGGPF